MTVDYADKDITLTNAKNISQDVKVYNNVSVIGVKESDSNIVVRNNDKIHTIKEKTKVKRKIPQYPTYTITSKPSCGCGYQYTWFTRTWINYCPNCHHWNCLGNKHKWGSRYEQEVTCFVCDSDYCGVCGKEKYSWSRVYLRKC